MSQIVMIRRMIRLILAALLILCCRMPNTCADPFPVVWETGVGGNGHAYLLVEESATFAQALSGAPSYHWTGAGEGYLATITSANEQEFIYAYLNSTAPAVMISTYWIGSQKTSPNNTNWLWINGPEKGIEFFDQTFRNLTYHCCCLTYCAWGYRSGIGWDPNNQGGVEDSLSVILHAGAYDTPLPWNDASRYLSYQGYLVEFGGYPLESAAITNLSAPGFGVTFPTSSPTHQLSPSLGSQFVRFTFATISEFDGSSVVRSLDIDGSMNFLGRFENDTLLSFVSPLGFLDAPNSSSLVFTFVRSVGGTNETRLLGEEFSGQILRWSMKIQGGWPFDQPTNFLRLDLNVSSGSGDQMLLLASLSNGTELLTVQDGDGFFVFLALLDEVTVDGNLSTMTREPMLSGNQLQIFLPSFQRELLLDPTLAILVQSDGGDGGNDEPLIIGLTVGLVGALLVVFVMGGLVASGVAVVLNFWRRRGIGKAINWEGKTAASSL